MVDVQLSEHRLAALYELFCPPDGRSDFGFYLPLVMSARCVLDVACGTGALLSIARDRGHTGRLCGLDPAVGMLEVARERSDIEWIPADLAGAPAWDQAFDLVVLTGHAFQVLLGDDELHVALAAVAAALTDDGSFVFETRNPLVRDWEDWHVRYSGEVVDPAGSVVRCACEVAMPVEGDLVSATHTYTSPGWDRLWQSRSTLRFLDPEALSAFLADAGLAVAEQFGDWDRSPLDYDSPEVITVARRRR
ncbi:methyltransferase domain-containing protein [Saccharopolyspora spinosa]|uniref:Ubiquinone/menaquinone biosynthesis C-methylase UbiE n=1 Tax=Saccharopolyspora spinosa TaxID=60894 RepID=A0A2N3XXI6_SACSN|nr:class I SAM-dependent methyltransferase [Saccharopolyspora spinosa]PKW15360.1 ubiquinone/menaquinone biosynthesis C-methylase UbiE [Saccharopolyspora spinosa]